MVLFCVPSRAEDLSMGALIVDDNEDMRSLVRLLVELDPDLEVAAEAADACEALVAWRRHRPTSVVMDQQLPSAAGLDVAEMLLREDPGLPIVLFSAYLDDAAIERAQALGIRACISKDQVARLPELLAQHRRR
jgi:DNA-binding NarL/FixJ family response regulator